MKDQNESNTSTMENDNSNFNFHHEELQLSNNNNRLFESAQNSIQSAATDLLIRSEVSSILHSMLSDVETQYTLHQQHSHVQQINKLQHQLSMSQNELQERRALHNASVEQRRQLGNQFVTELFVLSVKLQELEGWRTSNFDKVQQFDQLQRELERAQEAVRTLKRQTSLNANAMRDPSLPAATAAVTAAATITASNNTGASTSYSTPTETKGKKLVSVTDNKEETKKETESPAIKPVDDISSAATTDEIQIKPPPTPTKTNKSKQKKKPKRYPKASFTQLKDDILLEIFAFLDAVEVIQAAQVNKAFYLKVNSMFGNVSSMDPDDNVVVIDEEEEDDGDDDSSEDDGDEEQSLKNAEIVESKTNLTASTTANSNVESKTTAPATKVNVASSQPTPAPTIVALPPKSTSTTSLASNSTSSTKTQQQNRAAVISSNPISHMFSNMLQPKPGTSNTSSTPSSLPTKITTTTTKPDASKKNNNINSSNIPNPTGLTAQMANSMANKLSPSELSVIISMTEKISRITAEREDLSARLEGTEAVKEFLISKVRDAELALGKQHSESAFVTQQSASDQEVISFLDGRVQELERSYHTCQTQKTSIENEFQQFQRSSSQKTKVIEDMLQFERQQLADQEKEWKLTKKVLVKEVKHCRAQIATLQAERDAFYQQNERLKQALLTLNGGGLYGSSSNSSSGSHSGGVALNKGTSSRTKVER